MFPTIFQHFMWLHVFLQPPEESQSARMETKTLPCQRTPLTDWLFNKEDNNFHEPTLLVSFILFRLKDTVCPLVSVASFYKKHDLCSNQLNVVK